MTALSVAGTRPRASGSTSSGAAQQGSARRGRAGDGSGAGALTYAQTAATGMALETLAVDRRAQSQRTSQTVTTAPRTLRRSRLARLEMLTMQTPASSKGPGPPNIGNSCWLNSTLNLIVMYDVLYTTFRPAVEAGIRERAGLYLTNPERNKEVIRVWGGEITGCKDVAVVRMALSLPMRAVLQHLRDRWENPIDATLTACEEIRGGTRRQGSGWRRTSPD